MREIVIDTDTRVYYIFEDKKFYVENKDTTTYRLTAIDTKAVLDIVAPSNTVTVDDLTSLATTYETLTSLSYTWSDDGSYMSTIQLNDFSKYPLTLDTGKGKLYIMNTELIFDLTTNESGVQRVQYMQAFYHDKLGLNVEQADLTTLYNLLVSFYSPNPYNVIQASEDKTLALKYNNVIKYSNFNSKAPAVYTLTFNPNNKFTDTTLAYILSLQDKVITLTDTVPTSIHVGDKLTITNAYTYVENYPYSANGEYTVTAIEGNTITVDENFPTPYVYTPPILNIVAYESLIEEVSREDNTITCDNQADLSSFLIGDKIIIKGTEIVTEYETLTVDGEYTISDISGHVITVEEKPVTNYTYESGTQPYVYKRIANGEVESIASNVITLTANPQIPLTANTPICIIYPNSNVEYTKIVSVSDNVITVTDSMTEFTANYGLINTAVPSTEVLITVTDTTKENVMPNTSFIVDNNAECTQYLNLLPTLTAPSETMYNKVNGYVDTTYAVSTTVGVTSMSLLGLYSEVYTDSNN